MINVEAQRAVVRLRAKQSGNRMPLAEARRDEDTGLRASSFPAGARFSFSAQLDDLAA